MSAPRTIEALEAELGRLRKELRHARRDATQWRRIAETSESMSTQSKRVMLRTQEDLERTIAELEEATRDAQLASEAKGRFLAVMSHEIRTPLNGILGTLELIERTRLDRDQGELVQVVHDSSVALLRIVNDVLDFSKLEADAVTLEREPFDVRACLRDVVRTFRSSAIGKGVDLAAAWTDEVPEYVVGDVGRLRQVILNLVGNAVKFTSEGRVDLTMKAGGAPGRVRFEVADTGIGISSDAIARIFDVFTQEDTSTTRRFGGTGLGLAISRRLVHRMGSRIEVDSEVGRGSRFSFELDLPAAETAPIVAARGETRVRQSGPVEHRFRRALVADDNAVNRLIAGRILEALGVAVETASDGDEAVRRVRDEAFDVVLMDCSMPAMDGYAATRAIRSLDGDAKAVPIVAMTAYALEGDREKCIAAGMNEYLAKPIRIQDMESVLRALALALDGVDRPGAGDEGASIRPA